MCGADDRGRDVSWRPSYGESNLLFGHFTRHEGLFGLTAMCDFNIQAKCIVVRYLGSPTYRLF